MQAEVTNAANRRWWQRASFAWLACLLLGLLVASSQGACTVGGNCKYDTDCPLDALCLEGRCDDKPKGGKLIGCQQDADCPNTDICIQKKCRPIGALFDKPTQDSGPPPPPDTTPPQERSAGDRPTPPTDGPAPGDTPTPDNAAPDRPAPPPRLGPTPPTHAISSGGAISSNAKYKHFAIVGQACPVVPASTVMRSTNYSVRVGVIAVSLW